MRAKDFPFTIKKGIRKRTVLQAVRCSNRFTDLSMELYVLEMKMVTKVERERAALEQAEKELKERKLRLAELEREEDQKALERAVKKVGLGRAIEILELAAKMKPQTALDTLKSVSS